MKTINELKELSVTVPGVIADNGTNAQAALASLESEEGILRFRCQAHSMNLLLKDVAAVFGQVFSRMGSIEDFFRTTHYARTQYIQKMASVEGALLRQPVSTRWCTDRTSPGFVRRAVERLGRAAQNPLWSHSAPPAVQIRTVSQD